MIKPILYHSFEEKAQLEKELFSKLSPAERKRASKAWMESAAAATIVKERSDKKTSVKRKK